MTDLDKVLASLRADPFDWTGHLVCADLLEDAGQGKRAKRFREIGAKRGEELSLIEFSVWLGYGKWSAMFKRTRFLYQTDTFESMIGLVKNAPRFAVRTRCLTRLPFSTPPFWAVWTIIWKGDRDTTINIGDNTVSFFHDEKGTIAFQRIVDEEAAILQQLYPGKAIITSWGDTVGVPGRPFREWWFNIYVRKNPNMASDRISYGH